MVPTLRAVSSLGDVLHGSEADVNIPCIVMTTLQSSYRHNCGRSSTKHELSNQRLPYRAVMTLYCSNKHKY